MGTDLQDQQAEIREKVLDRQRALTAHQVFTLSQKIGQRFLMIARSNVSWRGLKVALYRSMPKEIQFEEIDEWFNVVQAVTCYPRIEGASKSQSSGRLILLHPPLLQEQPWEKNGYGIFEPPLEGSKPYPISQMDVIFVPGVAFSEDGKRIGRGKGFYDRLLSEAPQALKIVLAFDFQIVKEEIPQQPHDQKVDWILTESSDFRGPGFERWAQARNIKFK